MMPDHVAQTYEQGEGLGLVFSDTDVNASSHPYMGQWMAHWNQAYKSPSSKGKTCSRPPKCVASPNLRKSKFTSASPTEEAVCRSVGKSDKVEHPASTERTSSSIKETSAPRTECMAADHFLSHVKIADLSYTSELETCRRWVKRLQHNHSETFSLCTKRFKKCNSFSSEMQNMCNRMQNYSTISHDIDRCIKGHKFEKTMTFSENDSPSLGDTEEALKSWIRRWRCNRHQTPPTASRPFQPYNLRATPGKFEDKKFASIGAMALMGKAMNNYRPCRIQRKESSLVWTT